MAVTPTFTFHDWLRALAERLRPAPHRDGSEAPVWLARGAMWSTHTHEGEHWVLTCGNGQLWLTREGDARDYVLGPGDTVGLDAPGHVVVQALRPARFCLVRHAGSRVQRLPAPEASVRAP